MKLLADRPTPRWHRVCLRAADGSPSFAFTLLLQATLRVFAEACA